MKVKIFNIVLKALIVLHFLGNILNYIFHFGGAISSILDTIMFCIIGIVFLLFALKLSGSILKLSLMIGGIYLIIMNFMPDFEMKPYLGAVSIIAPMLIGRYSIASRQRN